VSDPDDRWRHATQPAGGSQEAPTARDNPRPVPAPARKQSSPFDPPRRDRFAERAELGRGGMGRVFEAHDTALDRAVAIKQSLTDNTGDLARFEREARITARLQHPGIVPVLDAGRDAEGRPFYIMRKIEGRMLADVIAEAHTIEDKLALVPRMLTAVDAVAYAHARGVIHRDLKSWNVLLGPFGETLVIDWGLARELDEADVDAAAPDRADPSPGLTYVGQALGTPGFMAPEQARGEVLDPRADVFALGATLFHVLSGKRALKGDDATQSIAAAAAGERFELEQQEGIPAELVAITRKAMEPDRNDRYADAGELASDLRRFTNGQLVVAHRYTARDLFVRWLRRYRLAVTIAGLAALALAVVAVIAVRQVLDERDRADEARERADEARAAAAVRADELLVERAAATVTQDPAGALAHLKQLEPTSLAWHRALPVAQTAQAFGVGWGRMIPDVDPKDVRPIRFVSSPDDSRVVLITRSTVRLVDPSLRTPPRDLAKLEISSGKLAAWVSATDGVAVVDRAGALHHVDTSTGATRPLQAGGVIDTLLPTAEDGRLIAVVDHTRLVAIDPMGGPPTVVITTTESIRQAQRVAGATVYATERKLWFQPDAGAAQLVREGPGAPLFNVEPVTRRMLTIEDGTIREWELAASAVARKSWKHPASAVAYAGVSPIAIDSGGVFWLNDDGEWSRDRHASLYATISVTHLLLATSSAAAFLSMPGSLRMFGFGRSMEISGRVEAQSALVVSGHYLLGVNASGLLRSWNLEGVVPTMVFDEEGGNPIGWNDSVIWFRTTKNTLLSARVENGKLLQSSDFGAVKRRCHGPGRDVLVSVEPPARFEIVDHVAKTRIGLPEDTIGIACASDAAMIALATGEGVTLLDARAMSRSTIAHDRPLRQVAVEQGWLAFVDDRGMLVRIEIATGVRAVTTIEAIEQLSMEATGRVGFARGDRAWTWNGRDTPVRVDMAERAVLVMVPSAAGLVIITADHALTVVDGTGTARSYQTGSRMQPAIARSAPFAAITALDQNLAILDLSTGAIRYLPWWADGVQLGADGQSVFGAFGKLALISRSTVPHDIAKLRAWVHDATNATLDPGSTRILFR
jgi:hypothetical protein